MKNVRFIYNPNSGENLVLQKLDSIIEAYQDRGYRIMPYRLGEGSNMAEALSDFEIFNYDHILISGGDGTVNSLVNNMKEKEIDIPIGILPLGTANDFGFYLGMPKDVIQACHKILDSVPKSYDVGLINGRYFINVASTGTFTDVSKETDTELKNTLGKFAYIIKGIEKLPTITPKEITIKTLEKTYSLNAFTVLVFNGKTAGNFKLASLSEADDGLFDVVVIKEDIVKNAIQVFLNMAWGEGIYDMNGILYFKTSELEIISKEDLPTDIDGEEGPKYPLKLSCQKDGIKILGVDLRNQG